MDKIQFVKQLEADASEVFQRGNGRMPLTNINHQQLFLWAISDLTGNESLYRALRAYALCDVILESVPCDNFPEKNEVLEHGSFRVTRNSWLGAEHIVCKHPVNTFASMDLLIERKHNSTQLYFNQWRGNLGDVISLARFLTEEMHKTNKSHSFLYNFWRGITFPMSWAWTDEKTQCDPPSDELVESLLIKHDFYNKPLPCKQDGRYLRLTQNRPGAIPTLFSNIRSDNEPTIPPCLSCFMREATVTVQPCGHKLVCFLCKEELEQEQSKQNKCLICGHAFMF